MFQIEHELEYPTDRNNSVTPMNQLLITLRFLSTGTFQVVNGDLFGVHKSTVCRKVHHCIDKIGRLAPKYIKFPSTREEVENAMQRFYKNSGFPGVIGAIDCTHIPITSPSIQIGEQFRNRKGYFSMNVQLVCEPTLYISDVVAGWPGAHHDANIFDNSSLRAKFEWGELPQGYLVGDSGYPLRSYLLTPVSNPENDREVNYNTSHVQARNCIERANGVLKRRFPALQYGLRVNIENVPGIIVAAVVLHNIALFMNDEEPAEDAELAELLAERRRKGIVVDFDPAEALPIQIQGSTANSQRKSIIDTHFVN